MDDHFFRHLHPILSTKEYKFQQRKSAPTGSEGECLAVCLIWIKEKITSTRFGLFRTSEFAASESNVHAHNLGIMARARSLGGHRSFNQLGDIENRLGLENETGVPASYVSNRLSQGLDLEISLVGLVAELQPGTAACAMMTIAGAQAGHAIAMYRSRSGSLHFFDPNSGIYKVQHAPAFISGWLEGCRNRGWTGMRPDFRAGAAQSSWCQLYSRG
jgi:hypothetical protein